MEHPGLQWQWNANPETGWIRIDPERQTLVLPAVEMPQGAVNLWTVPNLLMQKFPAPEFVVTTKVKAHLHQPDDCAGLLVMGIDYAYLGIRKTTSGDALIFVTCSESDKSTAETLEWSEPVTADYVFLRADVSSGARVKFSFSRDNISFREVGRTFKAKPGKWIGARIGLFASSPHGSGSKGYLEANWFRFYPAEKHEPEKTDI
jgi:hypothetical protein